MGREGWGYGHNAIGTQRVAGTENLSRQQRGLVFRQDFSQNGKKMVSFDVRWWLGLGKKLVLKQKGVSNREYSRHP